MQASSKTRRRSVVQKACRHVVEALESRTLLNAADLDTTFGTGGISELTLNGFGKDVGTATAVQSDGKTIVVGEAQGVDQYMVAARYNTNGTLDSTFGTGGEAIVSVGLWSKADAVAIQPDGKIILAGYGGNSVFDGTPDYPAVARLLSNGQLDTTFNTTGTEFIESANRGQINSIALQSDGKIVVGGWTASATSLQNFTLARINTSGGLDSTFGTAGITVTPITASGQSQDQINGIAIDSSGRIVAAGSVASGITYKFSVARYTSTGALDTTFGTSGVTTTSYTTHDVGFGVAIQSDGKIDVGGASSNSFTALRYLSTGVLDTTFGSSGHTTITTGNDVCTGIAVTSTGSVVLAGYGNRSGVLVCIVDRLTSSGALDTSFNGTGIVTAGSAEAMNGVALHADGTVVVTGYNNVLQNFNTIQFTPSGALDTSFGGGEVVTDFTIPVKASALFTQLQADGKIVIAGTYAAGSTNSRSSQVFVARVNANGTPDSTFGTAGVVTHTVGRLSTVRSLIIQPGGDIVIGGSTLPVGTSSIAHPYVTRFLPSGAVDTTFGVSGEQDFTMVAGNFSMVDLLPKQDGSFFSVIGSGSTNILHLTSSGQIDLSFGSSGIVSSSTVYGVAAIDPSDDIVAIVQNGTHIDRFLPTGALDATFTNASTGSDVEAYGGSNSLVCQPDGKILVIGDIGDSLGTIIERYTVTGARDTTFGSSGFQYGTAGGDEYFGARLQPDGSMIVFGSTPVIANNTTAGIVAEYDASGHAITTFGNNGSAKTSFYLINDVATKNGKIILAGYKDTTAAVGQLVGAPQSTINGTAGADAITLTESADHTSVSWTGAGQSGQVSNTDPAGLTINGNGGSDTITLVSADGSLSLKSLNLNGVFTLSGLGATGNPLAGTTIDLNTSTLFISYASPTADPISLIQGYLKNGYNNGAWTGAATPTTGAIRSTAAAASPLSFSVGYADSSDLANPASLPVNTIELRYTAIGDTNLDGTVGLNDLAALLKSFSTGTRWDQGDITYGSTTGLTDLAALLKHFNNTANSPAALPSATPADSVAPLAAADLSPTNPSGSPITISVSPSADDLKPKKLGKGKWKNRR